MHYYSFNIGDYKRDTSHLTPIEHFIYRTLIDWYYLDEKPIPLETQWVTRRLGLGTESEPTVKQVLSDFFKNMADGWHHTRIDAEISEYHALCVKNQHNGKLGGRPKKTQSVSSGNPTETLNHKPITINQEIKNTLVNSKTVDNCPYEEIVSSYHKNLPMLAAIRFLTDKRKRAMKARWSEDKERQSLDWWDRFFSYIATIPFYTGKNDRGWQADIDFILRQDKFVQIIEGCRQSTKDAA